MGSRFRSTLTLFTEASGFFQIPTGRVVVVGAQVTV
jgi:hypothetical protein